MNSDEIKINKLFIYWLTVSLFLVLTLIIVGGLTRLTNSGLSIIEWELFSGILPPLNDASWALYFEKYKTIPQYQLINSNMSLDEFKVIFYWEYFHRILARIIGIFFFIPLIFFYYSKCIKKKYLISSTGIFLLIVLQGIFGWYMVKSGLVFDVTVSHYRLSLHLTTAIIIISFIFWLMINILNDKDKIFFKFTKDYLPYQILLILLFSQIILGAFVSGLDAGMIYQTWPKMGSSYIPDDLSVNKIQNILDFDNHSLVQFYHRNLAYFIIIYSLCLSFKIFKNKRKNLYHPIRILLLFLSIQIIFGISTLVSGLNIYLASIHQILGVLLVLSGINLYYFNAK